MYCIITVSNSKISEQVLMTCRCGVKKPDYPSVRDKCYCLEKKPGPERSDAGDGVKNGFWHKMEVLSLPWHQDLFWPNTSMFKVRLVMHLVQELGANTDHCRTPRGCWRRSAGRVLSRQFR